MSINSTPTAQVPFFVHTCSLYVWRSEATLDIVPQAVFLPTFFVLRQESLTDLELTTLVGQSPGDGFCLPAYLYQPPVLDL